MTLPLQSSSPAVYDPADGRWHAEATIGGTCGQMFVQFWCDPLVVPGMNIRLIVPSHGIDQTKRAIETALTYAQPAWQAAFQCNLADCGFEDPEFVLVTIRKPGGPGPPP